MKPFFSCKLSAALLLATLSTSHIAAAQTAKPASAKNPSWIAVQATTDKDQYAPDEPIKVTLKATNIVKRDAYLKYSSGQRFELKLYRASPIRSNATNEPVYTWSANKSFLIMTEHIKLTAGQSETYQGEIGGEMGELAPGLYRLEAQLTNSSGIRAAPVNFSVVAGATAPDAPTSAPTDAPDATLSATTEKTFYKVGEKIDVNCLLQNNSASATTFTFGSGQTYDVFIRNSDGEVVWNWAANKRFLMVSRPITLEAGAQEKFTVEWDGRALPGYKITPGKYTIEAVWASTPEVEAAPIAIEIR